MNNEIAMWIGGFLILGAYGISGAAFKIALTCYNHISSRTSDHSERIIRLETLSEIQGKTLARKLHSPHTPELDKLLEGYYERNYELTLKEWERLLELCQQAVKENEGTDKADYAEFLAGICHHKLRHVVPINPMAREQKIDIDHKYQEELIND